MTAQTLGNFSDPYSFDLANQTPWNASEGAYFTNSQGQKTNHLQWGTKGIPGLVMNMLGFDTENMRERENLRNDQLYERANIESARAWSEYMDSTATQRRVKDIEAAGLNPWLAVQNGLSASASSGSVDMGGSAKHKTNSEQSLSGIAALITGLIQLLAG